MNKLNTIFNAFMLLTATNKRIELDLDKYRTRVWTSINGRLQKWTDYKDEGEFLRDTENPDSNLDDCIEYLQSFELDFKGMDLNEINHIIKERELK